MQQLSPAKIEQARLLALAGKKMTELPAFQKIILTPQPDLISRAEALGIQSAIAIVVDMVAELVAEPDEVKAHA